MSFKPHSWYPPPDSNGDNVVMQAPPIARVIVDKSDSTATDASADYIIDSYAASISHFVDACRQNYSQGTPSYWRGQDTFPGLRVDVEINNRREIITFTVKPSEFRQSQESNFDGYIAWVRPVPYAGGVEGGTTLRDATLFINGYAVIDTKKFGTPVLDTGGVYVVMFGPTALRCHSLADNENPFKAGVTEPDHTTPVKLVSAIIPGRKKVDNHDDLPAYFALQWSQPFNVYTSQIDATLPIAGYVQFKKEDAKQAESPLLSTSTNDIVVWPQGYAGGLASLGDSSYGSTPETLPGPTPGDDGGEIIFAEFYDRKEHRRVSQSWTVTPGPGGNVTINDKPQWWFGGGGRTNAQWFDLTPYSITLKPVTIDLSAGQTTGVTPGETSNPTSHDAQYQTLDPNAFWQRVAAYFTERITLRNAYTTALGVVFTDSGWDSDAGFFSSVVTLSGSGLSEYEANQTAWYNCQTAVNDAMATTLTTLTYPTALAAMDAAYSALVAATAAYVAALIARYGPGVFPATDATSPSGLISQAQYTHYQTDFPALRAAIVAYQTYRLNPPVWKDYQGKSIGGFSHRTITVDHGALSVGEWTTEADTA